MWKLFSSANSPKHSTSEKTEDRSSDANGKTPETSKAQLYTELIDLVELRYLLKQRKLNQQQQLLASNLGNHHATRKGRGMTFSEVRQYQPGDDIRHIDWRVTARTQKTHTKVFVEEHERPTFLVTEQTPALFFGSKVRLKTSQAMNLAAALAWCSLNQNERVGGIGFNHQQTIWVSPKRSQKSVLNYLQQTLNLQHKLYRPATNQAHHWPKTLQQLAKTARPGAKIFLIGDMMNMVQTAMPSLQMLKHHLDIVALHLVDPLEKQLPELGWLSLTRTFGDDPVHLDSFRRQTQKKYQQAYETSWLMTKELLNQQQIPLFEINNQQDVIAQLVAHRIII